MPPSTVTLPSPDELAWLGEVRDVHPGNPTQPLVVRKKARTSKGLESALSYPEQHPYCELSILIEGKVIQYVGTEKIERGAGSIILIGPSTPHHEVHIAYPYCAITVHFLPILLLEMGPKKDGVEMLSRFTSGRSLSDLIINLPNPILREMIDIFQKMEEEYAHQRTGSELRLKGLLVEILVRLLRWEEADKKVDAPRTEQPDWLQIEKALRFIHKNYAEPLYIEQIARAAGVSINRFQAKFREAMGMSCVHYLRTYRISQAKALLCLPQARITEVALAVGFDALSNFNTSFRDMIGMSPTEYMHSYHQKKLSAAR